MNLSAPLLSLAYGRIYEQSKEKTYKLNFDRKGISEISVINN